MQTRKASKRPRQAQRERIARNTATKPNQTALDPGPTTRKTIEVPESYFFKVKERAVQRRIREKHLWTEIVSEYFERHPEP